jgi:gas vesicle protein
MSKKALPPPPSIIAKSSSRISTDEYPNTVILSITTHGEIPVELKTITSIGGSSTQTNVPKTFTIPDSIQEFYKFNAVAPGIINFVAGDNDIHVSDVEKINNGLKRNYREYIPQFTEIIDGDEVSTMNLMIRNHMERNNITKKSIKHTADKLLPKIKASISERLTNQEESLKDSIKELKKGKKKEEIDELTEEINDIQHYIRSFPRGDQLVNCITASRTMINKQYSLGKHDRSRNEDWSITCLNMPRNQGSLYTKIIESKGETTRGTQIAPVNLSDIVTYLAERGVTRLFIVDLTCAPFSNDAGYLEYNADGRRIRNNIIGTLTKMPYGGKRRRPKTKRRNEGSRDNRNRRRKSRSNRRNNN